MIGLIADIWCHGRGLSLAILSSSPSWTGSVQRYSNKSPSDWGRHVPPLMVVQHLLSCRLHLYIPPGLDTYTHTHTHTHTADTSTCVYTHACSSRGHKHKQGTQEFQIKMTQSCNVRDRDSRYHVLLLGLPVHLPRTLLYFPKAA